MSDRVGVSNDDLDLVETTRLISALQRRYFATLIVLEEEDNVLQAQGMRERYVTWSGGFTQGWGLASYGFAYFETLAKECVRDDIGRS